MKFYTLSSSTLPRWKNLPEMTASPSITTANSVSLISWKRAWALFRFSMLILGYLFLMLYILLLFVFVRVRRRDLRQKRENRKATYRIKPHTTKACDVEGNDVTNDIAHCEDEMKLEQTATNQPNFLQLPGELRNEILRFTVVPGHVQLPQIYQATPEPTIIPRPNTTQPLSHQFTAYANRVSLALNRPHRLRSPPSNNLATPSPKANLGLSILAASKQTYTESHALYWSTNTFFLPPGPLPHTLFFFGAISPSHKTLITHLGIRLSLADLSPPVIEELETRFTHDENPLVLPANHDGARWGDIISLLLLELWIAKLEWLRNWSGEVEVVFVDCGGEMHVLDLRRKKARKWTRSAEFVVRARDKVRRVLFERVRAVGWGAVRDALGEGALAGGGL